MTADAALISNQQRWPKEALYAGKGKVAFQLSNRGKVSFKKFLCEKALTCMLSKDLHVILRPQGQDWKKTCA